MPGLMHRLMAYRQRTNSFGADEDPRQIFHAPSGRADFDLSLRETCSGAILEIGAFVGGATIAAALGVRDSGQAKKLIAVEPGGSVKHKRLGTRNILRDLERNLARERWRTCDIGQRKVV
jgi:predicted O-methyltransferase YrrM